MKNSTKGKTALKSRACATSFDIGAAFLRDQVKTLPASPGIYRMIGRDGATLYVGKAKNIKKRVASYTHRARLPLRLQRMVASINNLEFTLTRTEAEALLLEANYIQRFLPPYNILLRDDKSYPYILIARDHAFARLMKHRGARDRKGQYFGPFASGAAVTETLTLLQRGFMLRTCADGVFSNRSRPCLQYHIKRCTAPCVGLVTEAQYERQVADAIDYLKGKNQAIQKKLAAQMQFASDLQDYETAARIRDRIKVLTQIQSRQSIHVAGLDDADVMAIDRQADKTAVQVFFFRQARNYGARTYMLAHDSAQTRAEVFSAFIAQFYSDKTAPSLVIVDTLPEGASLLAEALSAQCGRKVRVVCPRAGDKRRLVDMAKKNAQEHLARTLAQSKEQARLLQGVAKAFGLPNVPKRIEVYDNSHTSGAFAVGAMIAAGAEGFLKKNYRKFTIREAAPDDDFAMMREVLSRRFSRLLEEGPSRSSGLWPDLVLIDGGAGQVAKVSGVLNALAIDNIPVVGIAKGPDRNAGRERFFPDFGAPVVLSSDDPVLYYLQRLRDEAHRFAIGTHRARRTKAMGRSRLDDIPGVGPKRKKALLNHLGSGKAVEEADVEDLIRAEGISRDLAFKIWSYFRK